MDLITIILGLLGLALIVPALGDDDGDDSDNEGEEVLGTPEDDILEATLKDDLIRGFEGDDTITAWDGDDTIYGGEGEDDINAGLGNDIVYGGEDRDVIHGRAGNDTLYGEGGNDTIEGGEGNDVIDAGAGNDIARGGRGDDVIYGNTGTNTLRGEGGNDDIFLWGEGGETFGGDGDDNLIMVTDRGTLEGGADDDVFYALANDDDEQQTVAIIRDFNLVSQDDKIVMTIDTNDETAVDKDIEVTVSEGTINGGSLGYNIEISFLNEDDEPDAFETSRVFVLGRGLDIEDVAAAIEVDVTVNAGLTVAGAQASFDAVQAGAEAPDLVTIVPPTPAP